MRRAQNSGDSDRRGGDFLAVTTPGCTRRIGCEKAPGSLRTSAIFGVRLGWCAHPCAPVGAQVPRNGVVHRLDTRPFPTVASRVGPMGPFLMSAASVPGTGAA